MNDHEPMNPMEFEMLADLLLSGEISSDQFKQLERLLLADASAISLFARRIEHAGIIHEVFSNEQVVRERRNGDDEVNELLDVIESLEEYDRSNSLDKAGFDSASSSDESLAFHDRFQNLFSFPKLTPWLAVAAVIGLAVGLLWLGGLVGPGAKPAADGSIDVVAELVFSSSDARWNSKGLSQGDLLNPGIIELASGEATIRFGNGAEVFLHAPSSFTLLSESSGHLHHGSLSAVVPESGKGFGIYVRGGLITDLGTSFDVVADEDNHSTRVEVTQGLVAVSPRANGEQGEAVLIHQNQFADIQSDGSQVQVFVRRKEHIRFAGPTTGRQIATGQIDPQWTIRFGNLGLSRPVYAVDTRGLNWLPGQASSSQWIALNAVPIDQNPGRVYFETELMIPQDIDPTTVQLDLRFVADDQLIAIYVNGELAAGPTDIYSRSPGTDATGRSQDWALAQVVKGFERGKNAIVIEVLNEAGPVGLRAEMTVSGESQYRPLVATEGVSDAD